MSLDPEVLLRGYAAGIFPMAPDRNSAEIRWIDPRQRAVFPLADFHVSRSLARHIRRTRPKVTLNQDFTSVVRACADRTETWISPAIFDAYRTLHAMGHAHSIEVWQGDTLAGGVYGVTLGAAFFGESMFSARTGGSKTALAYLVHRLRAGGFRLFDAQFMTDHLRSLGAAEISRADYRAQLATALALPAQIAPPGYPPDPSPELVLVPSGRSQPSTQTS